MRRLGMILVGAALLGVPVLANDRASDAPTLEEIKLKYHRPTEIPFPDDNPYSQAKAELGKTLFFDRRLSADNTISCATCHSPSYGWEDGRDKAVGHAAAVGGRHTPTILNLAYGELLMWDGRFSSLEEQVFGPLTAGVEMNIDPDVALARVAESPAYTEAFDEAFPGEGLSRDTFAKAIATFERTIISNEAPFDRWIAGDESAISAEAKRGFALFNGKANCDVCHSGWRFTDDGFHDIGVPSDDLGRGGVIPGIPVLEHAFKTPTLRNIAERAPYTHNGSIPTLRGVVEFYNDGFVERESLDFNMSKLGLTDQEIDDLVAFLMTLSSEDDPISLPVIPVRLTQEDL